MEFRTEINIPKNGIDIKHSDTLLLLGSCFATNIEKRLFEFKFNAFANPLGISFNPISLHNSLFEMKPLTWEKSDQGVHYNYNFHSDLNGLSVDECQKRYQKLFDLQDSYLKKASTIFITYGTAWVFELKSNAQIVNNCHKQAPTLFEKRMLSVKEIVSSWKNTAERLKELYQKDFNFIFTVSPIRHLKNGFHENQLSKAILLLATHEICADDNNCSYFPSYELLLDDLRDYRFYKANLTHPNEIAIDYIWQKIEETYFSNETIRLNQQLLKFKQALNHRAFQQNSSAHRKFLNSLKQKLILFQDQNGIDFSEEIKAIR